MRVVAVVTRRVRSRRCDAGGRRRVGDRRVRAACPTALPPGRRGSPTIFVKQHGLHAARGSAARRRDRRDGDGRSPTTFLATEEAAERGRRTTPSVVFPDAGDWRITVLSGFGDSHVDVRTSRDRTSRLRRRRAELRRGRRLRPVSRSSPSSGSSAGDASGRSTPVLRPGGNQFARRRCRNGRWRTGRRATPCSQSARGAATSVHTPSSCGRIRRIAFRTAYLLTGSADDAEEATQTGFVKAWKALPRFRPGAEFRPWLLRIVVNEAHNRRRSGKRREALGLRAAVEVASGDAVPSPEALALREEQRQELLAAVNRLDDRDRDVLACRYFLELSEEETADRARRPARDREVANGAGARPPPRRGGA